MNLKNVIFFTSETLDETSKKLLHQLEFMDVTPFWNPTGEDLLQIDINQSLIVSDTASGSHYAAKQGIPYIEKWNEALQNNDSPKPVCYYDAISALHYPYLLNQWKRAHHIPIEAITSNRLVMKELSIEDYKELYTIRQNPSIQAKLPALESLETELEKHQHYIQYQYEFFDYGLWGLYRKDGTLIGQAGIQNHEYQNETWLELSYLVAPEYQRNGYATEAILAIYEFVVNDLEINRLLAIIANNNLPSIRTAMNLGMKKKEAAKHQGFDCHYYVIDNINDFLVCYKNEQKRVNAAKSAFKKAMKHPVQEVYSRYRK